METVDVRKYDLSDSYLFENITNTTSVKVWIPEEICIVLGRSNNPPDALFIEDIIRDEIPVYKRPSGGETVILTPNTLIISIAIKQLSFKGGKTYFRVINNAIIEILQNHGINNLQFKGISDIAIDNIKILGSALYQNKDLVFYHAVLNIAESSDLMEKYLKHPTREPDYRNNRNHIEFVTSLKDENYDIKLSDLKKDFENKLSELHF
jgi:lipoate-protein ligase A